MSQSCPTIGPAPRIPRCRRAGAAFPAATSWRRVLTRQDWIVEAARRGARLPESDAVIVDVVPLPSEAQLVVHELLAIELDGDDLEALPTRICLTGFTAFPATPLPPRAPVASSARCCGPS